MADPDPFAARAARHGLAPVAYEALRGTPAAAALEPYAAAAVRRNLLLAAALAELAPALRDTPFLVLKGPAVAVRVHGGLARRPFADLDLLVRPRDVPRAWRALEALGYRPRESLADVPRARLIAWHHEVAFRRGAAAVELHWRLWPRDRGPCPDAFAAPAAFALGGREFRCLDDATLLAYLAAHGARHGWARLGWLHDVAELLRRRPGLARYAAVPARRCGKTRVLHLALALARDLFGAPAPRPRVAPFLLDGARRALLGDRPAGLAFELAASGSLHAAGARLFGLMRGRLVPNAKDRAHWGRRPALEPLYPLLRPLRRG